MPVAVCDAGCTVADGPPRVTCLGFQVCDGRLIGPADMFDDPAFEPVRRRCLELAGASGTTDPSSLIGHRPSQPLVRTTGGAARITPLFTDALSW